MSVPGRIVTLVVGGEPAEPVRSPGVRAIVDVAGVQRVIDVGLLGADVRPGDWILIHAGYALSKIDAEEAEATLALLAQLPELDVPLAETP